MPRRRRSRGERRSRCCCSRRAHCACCTPAGRRRRDGYSVWLYGWCRAPEDRPCRTCCSSRTTLASARSSKRGLGARGFMITSAPDGPSGADLASKLDVDIILLDLLLPGRAGLDVLTDIRAAKPRIPVIALTALDDTQSRVGGLDDGAADYVTKPFAVEELAARVRAR